MQKYIVILILSLFSYTQNTIGSDLNNDNLKLATSTNIHSTAYAGMQLNF